MPYSIFDAIKNNALKAVARLLEKDINLLEVRNTNDNFTPLHYAIRHKSSLETVELLLKKGANLKVWCMYGDVSCSPLGLSQYKKQRGGEVLLLLL
jgi:hypothetical protein